MRHRLRDLLWPLGAFAAARATLMIIAAAEGLSPWRNSIWVRWDSGHYLSIAAYGYALAPCLQDPARHAGTTTWCGNAGWLPGYPLLIRVLSPFGLDLTLTAATLSAVTHFATLFVLDRAFLHAERPAVRAATLTLAAFFPGFVYYHAVFPISLVTFAAFLCIASLTAGRWFLAGLSGAVLGFSYATGFVAAVAVAVWLFTLAEKRRLALPLLAVSGVTCLGFIAALAVQWWDTGVLDGFFRIQAQYHHHMHNPLETINGLLKPLPRPWADPRAVVASQSLFVVILLVGAGLWAGRHRPLDPTDRIALLWTLVYWLFPLTVAGRLSITRTEALLLPLVLLSRRWPAVLQWGLVAAAIVVGVRISRLFFAGLLV